MTTLTPAPTPAALVHPVELSADAKRNAHCYYCPIVEHRVNYAVCLKFVHDERADKLPRSMVACSRAINRGDCPAVVMQAKEVEKKQAIYFTERLRFVGLASLVDTAKGLFASRPSVAERKAARAAPPKPKDELELDIDTGGYQDAINAAAKEETVVVAQPGETLLDIARRMLRKDK